ncbi:dihydrofolate reductase family protein [Gordonia liuliyuniae]|uniref:Dihydrofolate reductase family protein n=1 Tax=Gordonia liuliyuniae TaxID=2911517 RepID=A0ABS9IR87_9ACTN|nr:dihydrofolate reductase family protein [Gordonia liuliyuniae]MCF8588063.1 dihydrofolate reductase family protein [Gordonia liuliyuniae]
MDDGFMFLMQKATDVTADDLPHVLAFPDRTAPTVRAMMIASVDGSATIGRRSGMLGGDGDHLVFHTVRRLADVIVVGAQTAVDEGYGPGVPDGDTPPTPLVLTSRTLALPDDFTTVAAPNVLIATCTAAPADARRRLTSAGATIVDCGTDDVDPVVLVAELASRGLTRIDLEGGPRLLAAFAAAGVLDQLVLTVSPTLALGDAPRIAHGAATPIRDQDLALPFRLPYPMRATTVLGDHEGFLYQLWEAVPDSDTTSGR